MFIVNTDLTFEDVKEEVEITFSPEQVTPITIWEAFLNEEIDQEEYNFLQANKYEFIIVGETTVFAQSEEDGLFTEYQSR